MAQQAVQPAEDAPPVEVTVEGDAPAPLEAAVPNADPQHPEMMNLALHLEPALLQEMARDVIDEYEADLASRTGWSDQHELWAKLYYQTDYAQSSEAVEDRTWGATESMPLLTEGANQFAARGRKTFFPNRDFLDAIVASLGTDGNGQEGADGTPPGNVLQTMLQKIKSSLGVGQQAPQDDEAQLAQMTKQLQGLRDRAKRVTKHMNFQLNFEAESYKEDKVSLFLATAVHGSMFTKVYPDFSTGKYIPTVENVRAVDLVVPYLVGPKKIDQVPRKTHRLFPTVLETEMMARSKFFTSACVPCMDIEGKMSGEDHAHAESEGLTTGTDVQTDSHARQAFVLEQHRFWEIDDPSGKEKGKIIAPVIIWVDYESREVKRVAIRYETDEQGNPINDRKPVEYFTHYKFFPNPDGFYGYGLGQMIGNINVAANITYRQVSDAATLANDGNMSGFISNRLAGTDGEEVVLEIGRFTPVPDTVGDISQGLFQFKFPGPSEASFKLLEMLVGYGQRLSGSTEAVTGTVDKVVQPTTLMTQLEQGLELPSSVMMGIADSISDELMKLYRLNRLHMKEKMYFVVDDEVQGVGPEDYAADLRLQTQFDAKMVIKAQRVAMAQAVLQGTLQNPNNQGRPEVIDEAFRQYFKALEVDDIDELIPPSAQPQRFDDQNVENTLFLMPTRPLFDVFPDQNHEQHLQIIDQFMQSPFGQQLMPPAAQALQLHRQKHLAYLYAEQTGVLPHAQPQLGLGSPTSPQASQGMGGIAANPGGFEPLAPALPGTAPTPTGPNVGGPA